MALLSVAASVLVPSSASYADGGLSVQPLAAPVITEAADYATTAFADPWDYSNAEDIRAYGGGTVAGGRLSFTSGDGYRADLIPYIPGAAPIGRDGARAPLDGRRFTNLSLRLYSSNGGSAAVLWTSCDWTNTACRGSKNFRVFPGWQTVVLPLAGATNWTRVIGLKLLPTNVAGTQIHLDWVRAYAPETPVDVTWTDESPGRAATLYWDTDSDQSNNTAGNPGWGPVGGLRLTADVNTLAFDASAYPSGSYQFYVSSTGGNSTTGDALRVVPRPRPVIDTPSMTSGADYATVIRKNAWDMSQATDGTTQFSVGRFAGGVLTGRNIGGNRDPAVTLAVPTPIAGSRFHYANFRMWIEGPFSIGFEPGGGMMARITWKVAGSNVWQNTNDLVVYPGWNDIVIDLATNPASKIIEPDQQGAKIGWAGKQIVTMRLDPNEDVGRKNWRVDFVRLTETPNALGAYDITLHDSVAQPDSTVEIWADKTFGTYTGRQLVTGLPVTAGGPTTFHWDPGLDVPAGTYWIWAKVKNAVGETRVYSAAPVTIKPLAGVQ
ncbi:MAG: hypothetical protein ABIM89_07535 [Mycobacteriales bacterium]